LETRVLVFSFYNVEYRNASSNKQSPLHFFIVFFAVSFVFVFSLLNQRTIVTTSTATKYCDRSM